MSSGTPKNIAVSRNGSQQRSRQQSAKRYLSEPVSKNTSITERLFSGFRKLTAILTIVLPVSRSLMGLCWIKMDIELWECDCNIMFFKFIPDYEMEIARNIETLKRVRNPCQQLKI